jgi:hypothetical protein
MITRCFDRGSYLTLQKSHAQKSKRGAQQKLTPVKIIWGDDEGNDNSIYDSDAGFQLKAAKFYKRYTKVASEKLQDG